MSYETLSGGLELVIPNTGTTNWGAVIRGATWVKINNHDHSGGGNGQPISGSSLVDNSITAQKLSNNLPVTVQPTLTVVAGVNTAVVDFNNGTKVTVDALAADGSVTPTFNNPVDGALYKITILQGSQVWLWPANVFWPGGEEPTQFAQTSEEIFVTLEYDGTRFLGDWQIYNY